MLTIIKNNIDTITSLCKANNVKYLYLVGSQAKGIATSHSDIDFLLDFNKNISIEEYSDNYFTLHYELKKILQKEIDIITENSLSNPVFIKSIHKNKELIYES